MYIYTQPGFIDEELGGPEGLCCGISQNRRIGLLAQTRVGLTWVFISCRENFENGLRGSFKTWRPPLKSLVWMSTVLYTCTFFCLSFLLWLCFLSCFFFFFLFDSVHCVYFYLSCAFSFIHSIFFFFFLFLFLSFYLL